MWEYSFAETSIAAQVQSISGGTNKIVKELIARESMQDRYLLTAWNPTVSLVSDLLQVKGRSSASLDLHIGTALILFSLC